MRKKFCAIGGEVLGYYKFIQAVAKDCAAKGEKLDALLDVINKQLDLAQQGVKAPCGSEPHGRRTVSTRSASAAGKSFISGISPASSAA